MTDEPRRYYALQYLRYKQAVFSHVAKGEWREADRARAIVHIYRGYSLGIDRQAEVERLVREDAKQKLMNVAGI